MARYRQDGESSPQPDPASEHRELGNTNGRRDSLEETEFRTSDREELIQCIKRGQRPTWVPKPNLEALCLEADAQAEARLANRSSLVRELDESTATGSKPEHPIAESSARAASNPQQPSALHTGDFGSTGGQRGNGLNIPRQSKRLASPSQTPYSDSPPPWTTASPFTHFQRTVSDPAGLDRIAPDQNMRSRAPSIANSLSSSFVMRAPTSPLVHATSIPSIDLPSVRGIGASGLQFNHSSGQDSAGSSSASYTPPNLGREGTIPTRNHQARRSLTSFTYQPAPSASTVYPSRQRRLSYASEMSPRQRNSMVGSFEESILRGRMSTAPSNPLEFVANIGVSGKGACPAKLKCPAHVTVPFPAVFYNYPSSMGTRSISDDSPSPYVGTINLRQYLETPVERRVKKTRQSLPPDSDLFLAEMTAISSSTQSDAPGTPGTASPSIKSSIGGAYRVPQQGQLQIILKNPENTAVKLFLVPYDLEGMLPDTKTFVRQRSFSTGPIMENVLSDKPIQDPLSNKHVLRYLIHLKFCCLGKGRFYLYDNIRVVFANRVPDGKEKLRNEIQLPEPRFSALSLTNSQPASRRQSGVDNFLPSPSPMLGSPQLNLFDGLAAGRSSLSFSPASVPFRLSHEREAEPFRKENVKLHDSRQASTGNSSNSSRPTSPEVHGFDRSSVSQRGSPVPWGTAIDLPRSPSPAFNGDGLLSKKLRELGRQTARASVDDSVDESLTRNLGVRVFEDGKT